MFFLSYDFFVIALPLGVLALSAALIGGILLYKKQSLLGDALGHGTYPGVILAYMLFATKSPKILALGAAFTAFCTLRVIQSLTKGEQGMRGESALALSLSGMFGLGMVLKTVITGNPHFAKASQSGLKSFLFGSAAFLQKEDFVLILFWSLFSLSLFFLFRKKELIQMTIKIVSVSFRSSILFNCNKILLRMHRGQQVSVSFRSSILFYLMEKMNMSCFNLMFPSPFGVQFSFIRFCKGICREK